MAPLASWKKEDVQKWIKSQQFSDRMKENALATLGECDGKIIVAIKTVDDLEDLDVKRVFRQKLLTAVLKLIEDNAKEIENKFSGMIGDDDEDGGSFKVKFDKSKSKLITSKREFTLSNTLYDLKQYYVDHEGGKVEELALIFNKKVYYKENDHKTLKEIGMTAMNTMVTIQWKTQGGAQADSKEEKEAEEEEHPLHRERRPNFKDKRITATKDADCIMGYDHDETRVKMPCGHVFAPVTIYQLTQRIFEKDGGYEVRCPMLKCKQLWSFDLLLSAADFNDAELVRFQRVFNRRYIVAHGDSQQCPTCKTMCDRPKDLSMQRVRCKSATCKNASDFCWICGQSWIGGGFRICGNKDCSTAMINEQLANCDKTTTMWTFEGKEIPKLRACPNCYARILHNEHCKHMKCTNCKIEFCFVCLKQKVDGKWTCKDNKGYWGTQCEIAPIQQIK